jgi:predicted esterase
MVGPHTAESVVTGGAPLAAAKAALILVHGRGATPESMLPLAQAVGPSDIAYVAPKAASNTWYPYAFTAPIAANEPWLSSALGVLADIAGDLQEQGFSAERLGLLGFSQGACLVTEFCARNARRYGCIIGLSGGLIGPPGTPRSYPGSLAGTPVFLGCSDIDPHIPLGRVEETATVLSGLGAEVDKRIYRGMGHTVNEDEIGAAREMLRRLAGRGAAGGG